MLPQTHEDFRRTVCVGCHKPGQKRTVNQNVAVFVREKIYSGFSLDNKSLPIGICNGCRVTVTTRDKIYDRKFDYDTLTRNMSRHDVQNGRCTCYICSAGRSKKLQSKKKKPGPKYLQSTSKPKTYKICSNCNGHLSRGINHKCWQTNKAKNTVRLAETQGTKEQVASTIIRDKQSGNGCDMTLKS